MNLAPQIQLNATPMHYSNGLRGIFQTIALMRSLVNQGRIEPDIRQCAISLIFLTPEKDEKSEATAIFEFVRDSIRYTRDINNVETIAAPMKTLQCQIGDCDDQSTLLAALLESVGYETRFIVAGYSTKNPEHVYIQVYVNGAWWSCDPTEQHLFGWFPPDPIVIYVENV